MGEKNILCERLRELRKRAGLTQEELAERIDVHLNTISRWENGIDTPKTFKIQRLAKALGCTEAELLNGPAVDNWELKLVVSKTNEGGTVDMTSSKSSAVLNISDDAMAITLSAGYELWENDQQFEELIEQLRRKRAVGLKTRREEW